MSFRIAHCNFLGKVKKFSVTFRVSHCIAHNGQGLLLCWYSLLVQPGTAADWKYEDEVNNKKLNRITSAGTAADSEQKDENIFVSQHSSKPPVSGMCFSVSRY